MVDKIELHADRLSRVNQALEAEDFATIEALLAELEPAEIAILLESLPHDDRALVWARVSRDDDGEVLLHVHDEARASLLADMDSEEIVAATEGMDSTDLAELIELLPEDVGDDVLRAMDAQQRLRVETMLAYDEDTAGRLMHVDTVSVRADVELEVVQRYLRFQGDAVPENTDMVMVVDREGVFVGRLPLARLVTRDQELTVAEVMDTEVDTIPATMSAHDVASLFETHDLVSAPVVDDDGRLLGRVTIDDVVDIIRGEADHTLMNMAGLDEEEDLFAPVLPSARRRAVWLGINLLTAFLAAWVIGLFQGTLEKIVALAVLMPIVASMGGIAGSQTLTLTIRGLALGQIGKSNSRWLLNKEMGIAAINGVIWALVVAVIAYLWFGNPMIGAVIGAALVINMLAAGIAGILVPLTLKRMGIDPALSGAVILTTVTDVVGFMSFLGLATLFLL